MFPSVPGTHLNLDFSMLCWCYLPLLTLGQVNMCAQSLAIEATVKQRYPLFWHLCYKNITFYIMKIFKFLDKTHQLFSKNGFTNVYNICAQQFLGACVIKLITVVISTKIFSANSPRFLCLSLSSLPRVTSTAVCHMQ